MNRYKHIINNWYLDTDRFNYILVKRSIAKTGKNAGSEVFSNEAFYPNLVALKRGIIQRCIIGGFINVELTLLLEQVDKLILKMEGIK